MKKSKKINNHSGFSAGKILIIGNRLLGDSIMSLDAVFSLKKRFPASQFFLFSPASAIPVYSALDIFSAVISEQDGAFLENCRKLAELRADLAFILPGGFYYALLCFGARIPLRIGHAGDFRTLLLSGWYKKNQNIYNGENFLNLLKTLPGNTEICRKKIIPTSAGTKQAGSFLFKNGISGYFMIAPGASEPGKKWPEEYFMELAGMLIENCRIKCIVTGSSAENALLERIVSGTGAVPACGLDLETITALLKGAAFLICNNSGLMHLAAKTGTKVFVLNGNSS
ncbi:MAG TPA: hypothetical protein DC049_05790, partial [Spirochaetia bacterium]|nr:hypothetical protein [Spirochaetia bacterium]